MKRLLWVVLLAAPPALATRVAVTSAQCPLDGTAVRVYEKLSTDHHGGWDSDLARYSSQGQWRAYALTTCPVDLLTLRGGDFDSVPTESLAVTQPILARWQARYPDADIMPAWERYELAAELYRALGSSSEQLAQLYLEGSWTARDQAVGIYNGLNGPAAARELLDAGAAELARELTDPMRKIVLHNLARVAHRGGFNAERDTLLDAFEAVGNLKSREQEVLTEFRHMATVVEPRLQDLAIAELERTLEGNTLDEVTRLKTTYLLADLHRRRGRIGEASAGFAFVVASSVSPDEIRETAAWLGAWLAAN